jgi:hypothetical protein
VTGEQLILLRLPAAVRDVLAAGAGRQKTGHRQNGRRKATQDRQLTHG